MVKLNCVTRRQSIVHHHKYSLFTFDIDLGVKVSQQVEHYLLHNVTYTHVGIKVASPNALES